MNYKQLQATLFIAGFILRVWENDAAFICLAGVAFITYLMIQEGALVLDSLWLLWAVSSLVVNEFNRIAHTLCLMNDNVYSVLGGILITIGSTCMLLHFYLDHNE